MGITKKQVTVDQLLALWNTSENMAKAKIESYYLKDKRQTIYVALENVNETEWFWSESEVKRFDRLWNMNMTLEGIAEQMERSMVSVLFLAFDRMYNEKVKLRDWDIW